MEGHGGDSIECGGQTPLLYESGSSRNHEGSESANVCEESTWKESSDWRASSIILGFECLQSATYSGVGANLVVYLRDVLHLSNASSATNAAIWTGTTFFTPLLGASIADSYLGNYCTILISSVIYLLGMAIVTFCSFTTIFESSTCIGCLRNYLTGNQNFMFFLGMYLVAFGSGGIKTTIIPFGIDQYNDANLVDRERKRKFFGLYYSCMIFGFLFSGIVIVWIQENISWPLGYGISTLCLALALGGFLLGTPIYQFRLPKGSPLKSVLQVLVAAFMKISTRVPTDSSILYEVNDKIEGSLTVQKLGHTEEFRFLDKAAIISDSDLKDGNLQKSWRICTLTQVEEMKILIRLLPIWLTSAIYSAAYFQTATTFIQQGKAMNASIGSFFVPPASLDSFKIVCVMIWVLVYNRFIMPFTRRYFANDVGLSQLQRMGIGHFIIIFGMTTAAYLENRRLDSAWNGEQLSLAWQLPQYFIMATSEAFCYVTQHEFFYSQAPETMKSMCTAFSLLALSVGNYLCSFIITAVAVVTATEGSPGWIPEDLNKGHLDYYFLAMAGLSTVNFTCFITYARNFTPKKVILEI